MFGTAIYFLFDRKTFFVESFPVLKDRLPLLHANSIFENLIICYGADLMWSVSFSFAIQAIYCFKNERIFYLLLCSLLGICYELLQMANVVPGTFDVFDIAAYIIGSIDSIIIIKMIWRKKDEKQQ